MWETLQFLVDAILSTRGGRAHARNLASIGGIIISMKMAWDFLYRAGIHAQLCDGDLCVFSKELSYAIG